MALPVPISVTELVDIPGAGPRGTRLAIVSTQGDSNYPLGGSIGAPAKWGFATIVAVLAFRKNGYVFDWVAGTSSLQAYRQPAVAAAGPMPEVAGGTDLSGQVFSFLVIGT